MKKATPAEVRKVLAALRKRMKGYDHCGNILDDIWSEQICVRALEFLSDEDHEILADNHTALAQATTIVVNSFLRWLSGLKRYAQHH